MNGKLALAAFVFAAACACTPAAAAYTAIFAFGDSLSDAGNIFSESRGTIPIGPPPIGPYIGGHFSNGPTWVEDLSQMLGLGTMSPFLAPSGGTNFAFGGAQTGITDNNPFDPSSPVHIDLPDQIAAFNLVDPNPVKGALYTLDIGANDILNALEDQIPPDELKTVMMQAEANTIDSVKALVGLGAQSLLFYEVPNLGLTPRFKGTALQETASDLAASFNAAVLEGLAGFKSDGLKVFTLDTYDLLGDIEANPAHYGFTNVSDPCWTGDFIHPNSGTLCSTDPSAQNQYLFWDEIHPTEAGHLLTAEFALQALAAPEPSTWAMLLVGSAGLGFAGYRHSRGRAITTCVRKG